MHTLRAKFSTLILGAVAGLSLLAVAGGGLQQAAAEGARVPDRGRPAAAGVVDTAVTHESVIHVDDRGGPVHRSLRVGLGKSVMLEFSRNLRDVMVSNPEAMDAVMLSSNRVFLLAKKIGETNAFFFDQNGEQFATFEMFVDRDTSGLQSLITRLIPGSDVHAEMVNETVVLTGHVHTPIDSQRAFEIARNFVNVELTQVAQQGSGAGLTAKSTVKEPNDRVINLITVDGEEQIMLRVQVAEVQRSVLKQFGINLASSINVGNFSTSVLTDNALPLTAAAGLGTLPVPGIDTSGSGGTSSCANTTCFYNSGPSSTTFGNSGTTSGWGGGHQRIQQAMRALERNGLVRMLAEPNLTAVSGEPAKFLAGGEYPIPTVDSTGQISVTYKEYGVGVAFTPIVLSEGRISLKIEAEVSELTNDGAVTLSNISIPALKKRQSKSTVELPSGGSLALAGLLQENISQNIDGFPGLKDLPVLGTLFRSRDFIRNETELVMIVTPYVVKPIARKDLARPGDGLAEQSDLRATFLGELNRVYGRGQPAPVGDLKGDYGFIVE